jgi:hypothetical protein
VQRVFIKKCFLFTVGSACCVKQFTSGSRNSLKDVRKSHMTPNQVTLLRLRQKQLYHGWNSNCTRMFPWFSMQHNARSFEASESVRTVGTHRTEGSRKMNRMGLFLQHLLGMQNQSVLQCNANISVHLQPKCSKFNVRNQLGRFCLLCFGIIMEYC